MTEEGENQGPKFAALSSAFDKAFAEENRLMQRIDELRKTIGDPLPDQFAKDLVDGLNLATDGAEALIARKNELDQSLRSLADTYLPWESGIMRVADVQAQLNLLLDEGDEKIREFLIGQGAYADIIKAATAELDQVKDKSDEVSDSAREIGFAFESALGKAITQGKDLKSVLGGLLQDMSQIVLNKTVLEPFGKLVEGYVDKIDFGALFGFATGGVVQTTLPHGVYTAPTVFPMRESGLHKYATGAGLLGEAGPEAVMPLKRIGGDLGVKATVGMPPFNVIVNNLPGQDAQVRQRDDGLEIDIIRNVVADDLLRGGSKISRSLESAYVGIRRGGR